MKLSNHALASFVGLLIFGAVFSAPASDSGPIRKLIKARQASKAAAAGAQGGSQAAQGAQVVQGAQSADQSQGQKPLRPRKRLRQAIMSKMTKQKQGNKSDATPTGGPPASTGPNTSPNSN